MYGLDAISFYLSQHDIYLSLPSGDYMLRIIVRAYLYMLLAIGLNIVCGFTGLLDLGYVGFYLIGGYTAGLLMARLGVTYWIALPLAVAEWRVVGAVAWRTHFTTHGRLFRDCHIRIRRTAFPYREKRTVVDWCSEWICS